jgi:hypothetical protein
MIRPAITYSYDIAGRSLFISAADEWSGKLVQSFLRDFHLDLLSHTFNSSYTIQISSETPAPAIPPVRENFEIAYGHCSTDGERYYLEVDDSLIVVNPVDSLQVWVGTTSHARTPLALVNLMGYVLEIALRRSGLFQLHGAGLVPEGQTGGALIVGASGSGKSTLTALLASAGWSYMTDDALLLKDEGNVIVARGIRRFFAASEATLASCSLLHLSEALGGAMLSDPAKRRLEPEVAFPGRFVHQCVPQSLFFASITGNEESVVKPLVQANTMSRLIRSNPWATYDRFSARDHLRVLSRLAAQCRAYAFMGGRDILADPTRAANLLLPLMNEGIRIGS